MAYITSDFWALNAATKEESELIGGRKDCTSFAMMTSKEEFLPTKNGLILFRAFLMLKFSNIMDMTLHPGRL